MTYTLKKHRAGFTLFELLTVLAVLSVVSVIGTSVFFKVTDAWNTVSKRAALARQAQSALQGMQWDFDNMLHPKVAGATLTGTRSAVPGSKYKRFNLEDYEITFPVLKPMPDGKTAHAILVRFAIEREEGKPAELVRYVGPLGQVPRSGRWIVATNVLSMKVVYLDQNQEFFEWDKQELPEAVRISLVLADPYRNYEQVCQQQTYAIRMNEG